MNSYPNINMRQTGKRMEAAIKTAGIDVKTLQEYLHLSCPQPIYRWFKGQVLPSVDHLYVISRLLGMHMEELLVPKQREDVVFMSNAAGIRAEIRIWSYYERLCGIAA